MLNDFYYVMYSLALFYFGCVFMKAVKEDNILNGVMGIVCAAAFILFVGRS